MLRQRRQRGVDSVIVLLLELRQRRPVLALPRNANRERLVSKVDIVPARSSDGEQQHLSSSVGAEPVGQEFKALHVDLGHPERSSKEEKKYVEDFLCKEFSSREVTYVRNSW